MAPRKPRMVLLVTAMTLAVLPLLPAGAVGRFDDDDNSEHETAIEAIAGIGVTTGCNPPVNDRFCPGAAVTRGEMAAFLRRALELPDATLSFIDTVDSVFEADIGAIAAAGITLGCDPPANERFCPDEPVTRGQMAAFLTRAFEYPRGPDAFVDDQGSVFEADIGALAAAGITRGCDPPANQSFCPDLPIPREQMATFLARSLGLIPVIESPGCPILPADDIWNTRVDTLPVDQASAAYIASIGVTATVHPDFGSGVWPPGSTSPIGIPSVTVGAETPDIPITFTAYGSESDPGPYPIPPGAPIEGGPDGEGDRHVLVIDTEDCHLYELFDARPVGAGWEAASGAVFDLQLSELRQDGWTSADAAGLPIYPGLVRYDEVASGRITHAIRFTAPETRSDHVWPARHDASSSTDPDLPPMGQRFRLRSDYDISGYPEDVQVILTAMKEYGLMLADNGSPWYLTGSPDPRWDNDALATLHSVPGSAFEAVDVTSLMIDPDSGRTG